MGGFAFLTTAATLAAVDGSYFGKLARQAGARNGSGTAEFFIDRSGKVGAGPGVVEVTASLRLCVIVTEACGCS